MFDVRCSMFACPFNPFQAPSGAAYSASNALVILMRLLSKPRKAQTCRWRCLDSRHSPLDSAIGPEFPFQGSRFDVQCSMFAHNPRPSSLVLSYCPQFPVQGSKFKVRCSMFDVRCSMFAGPQPSLALTALCWLAFAAQALGQ